MCWLFLPPSPPAPPPYPPFAYKEKKEVCGIEVMYVLIRAELTREKVCGIEVMDVSIRELN